MKEFRETQVLVIGSGAGGAAVAGELMRRGKEVLMVEAGPRKTDPLGSHIRNRDPSEAGLPRFNESLGEALVFASNGAGEGPAFKDLKVIHSVGGMFSFWTCNCPTPHPAERAPWIAEGEWETLLDRARGLLGVSYDLGAGGVRQERLIHRTAEVALKREEGRGVQRMPVAAKDEGGRLKFASCDNLLPAAARDNAQFLLTGCVCTAILHKGGRARGALLRSASGEEIEVHAEAVVVATGTVGTPKLLAGSKVDAGPALGAWLFDHPSIGSRVVLRPDILDGAPQDDPVFTVWIPFTPETPWHNQICRFPTNPTAIEYDAGPTETGDLFTFAAMDVLPENRFIFDFDRPDPFGLPQMRGEYRLSGADYGRIAAGLEEHFRIAGAVGDLVSHRWSPTFFGPGWSTHMMGSCRMGGKDDGTSCVDPDGRLWGHDNIYAAGNAIFSVSNAGNPTLMTVAMGLRTAGAIAARL